jgi:hypothetical protein
MYPSTVRFLLAPNSLRRGTPPTVKQVRRAQARIYRAARSGAIDIDLAVSLVWFLSMTREQLAAQALQRKNGRA